LQICTVFFLRAAIIGPHLALSRMLHKNL
jgi:hypothetical protein